jgi:hypothetical protein
MTFLHACAGKGARVDVVPERGDVYIIVVPPPLAEHGARDATAIAFDLANLVPGGRMATGTITPWQVTMRVPVPVARREWCYGLEQAIEARAGVDRPETK